MGACVRERELAQVLVAGLAKVPGVAGAGFCCQGEVWGTPQGDFEPPEACRERFQTEKRQGYCPDECPFETSGVGRRRFYLQGSRQAYGGVLMALDDQNAAEPYLPFLQNTVNDAALLIENRRQHQELLKTNRDLSDEVKRRTHELQLQQKLLDQIGDMVTVTDLSGNIVYANEAVHRCLGRRPGELVGHNVATYGDSPTLGATQTEIIETVRRDGHWKGEVVNQHADGAEVIVESHVWLIRNDQGTPECFCGIGRDVTDIRKAAEQQREFERQIQQTQKLESLGVLAGGIAHDFNNLLMGVLGNCDLARLEVSDASPAQPYLADAEAAARRAAGLCQQMLAYSGKGHFVIEDMNLNEVIEEMTHMLEVSISKHVVLQQRLATALAPVHGDATQLRQVVMNLVINASEAIGEKSGVISVTTGMLECDRRYLRETFLNEELAEGRYVFLEVTDTGCGMDRETQTRMFDPFFTTKFTGRGLGMAATLGIVRGHAGAIKVYSEPGEGTSIKVMFPAAITSAPDDAATPQTGAEPDWHSDGTVLLVDDEEIVRTPASGILSRLGFRVLTASDGREAVETYRERPDQIDLVLLDLTMPRMNGEVAFRELRRIDPNVRVILSSGYSEQDATRRFVGKGLAGFVQKPYEMSKIREALHKALEPRASQTEPA